MALEIRPARPEEMEEFKSIPATVFLPPPAERSEVPMRPEWTLCAFEDGRLATSYAAWPLTMRFNGKGVSAAGVTEIGTRPVYRRRGHLRKITTAHFELLHERGEQPLAILYASQAAIYHRFGYAVVSMFNEYSIEPRYLQFALVRPGTGAVREAGDDEFELFKDLYRRFCAERTGYIHRSKITWEAGVLASPPKGGVLSRVIYEEAGEPLGYIIYAVEPHPVRKSTGPWQQLFVRDLVWLTASAFQAAWNSLASMDLVRNIKCRAPEDDPLPHLLAEPRMLHSTSYDGLLARIVDIEKVLPERGFQEEGVLTFEILDDLCPWNQGRWKLETSAAEASITPTGEEPDLVMPISTLALLVFGQISATEAARMGRLDVLKPDALPLWDRVMRTKYRPFCADQF
ncbi:MAG: GNAT family N-acetyltransferase [Deltaproteobacteria bacterium]|nr:GNAT family N-acetyltransferase [Deltaproteobacteria bacterium]MBW2085735.1 GNAT family N-acetyltransferase [Deltaproteobacteria bacterium]